MDPQFETNPPEQEGRSRYSKKLNFILAISAMLISIASFYATYIQAVSAEQQVKAMTYPLIQFTHGNYDTSAKDQKLNLTLINSGVGPAIIKKVTFRYKEQDYGSLSAFLKACCSEELKLFSIERDKPDTSSDSHMITSKETGIILAAGEDTQLMQLFRRAPNAKLWNAINKARFEVEFSTCYCSLLDNCYISKNAGNVTEVDSCEGKPETLFGLFN